MLGLEGRVIGPLKGVFKHRTAQHRKSATNIHAWSGVGTHEIPVFERSKTVQLHGLVALSI